MTLLNSSHKPEIKRLLSGTSLTLLASGISQPAFSQSLPPFTEDGTNYQVVPQLPIITNLDLIQPSIGSPEKFSNEFGYKSAVTAITTSNDKKFKVIRSLSPISRLYRIPSPKDSDYAKKLGGRVVGAVELVEVLDTTNRKKFNAAIPLCSVRNGQLAYPVPESDPNLCSFATSNK